MPSRNIQNAAVRSTEGQVAGRKLSPAQATRGESNQAPRRRGRPVGSQNKPKGLLPKELASAVLLEMKGSLPEEHFEYMKGVIKEGKSISTKTELDTLILLLSRNLIPALVLEGKVDTEEERKSGSEFFDDDDDGDPTESQAEKAVNKALKMPLFRKDVTERLKVVQGLLSLRNQVEKREAESGNKNEPVIRIVAGRGIDAERLRILVGVERTPVDRNPDGNGQSADEAGTISGTVLERSELLPTGEQGSPDRVLDGDSG